MGIKQQGSSGETWSLTRGPSLFARWMSPSAHVRRTAHGQHPFFSVLLLPQRQRGSWRQLPMYFVCLHPNFLGAGGSQRERKAGQGQLKAVLSTHAHTTRARRWRDSLAHFRVRAVDTPGLRSTCAMLTRQNFGAVRGVHRNAVRVSTVVGRSAEKMPLFISELIG